MRYLLCGIAAGALSACSYNGANQQQYPYPTQQQNSYAYTTAQPTAGCCKGLSRWNLELEGGQDFVVGGTALTGDEAHPGFNQNTFNTVEMKDAYDHAVRWGLGGSYALNPNRKVTGTMYYKKANGNDVILGAQNNNPLRGTWGDYESFGAEVGLRQYANPVGFPLVKSIRPYIEGRVGGAHVRDIELKNVRELGVVGQSDVINMYKGGLVPTAAGLVGVETPIFDRFTMGIESGIRYTGKAKSDDTSIPSDFPQFGGTNNGSDLWSVPVMLRGRYRF